jgi:lysophospholipase L1-like esterase
MALLLSLLLSIDSTPKHGDVIVFVGDSITQAGDYVANVEAYLLACRPQDFFRVVNVGKSSETVSGTSEPDHRPRRPCIHDRFARDVAAFRPDVVVACYGMNDGNYFPWDEDRFEKFKSGMTRFIDRVFKETPARALVLLTPPPFDATRAPPPPADGKSFGYKSPAANYDGVLRRYSDWMFTQNSERVKVVDVHREFHLKWRKSPRVNFSPDGVHPSRLGHWLIAQTLLLEWTVRPSWRELTLDIQRPQASVSWNNGVWKWTTPPVGAPVAQIRRFIIESSFKNNGDKAVDDELFEQRIGFKGLANVPETTVAVHRQPNAVIQRKNGSYVFVQSWMLRPDANRFALLNLVHERRKRISSAWLGAQKDKPLGELKLSVQAIEKAESDVQELTKAIEELRKPRSFEVTLIGK